MSDQPDLKLLKKLADACRKAGIQTFKGHGIEFTLSHVAPESNYRRAKKSPVSEATQGPIETDGLTQEELLFWSTGEGHTEKAES